ncbi:hypothetical protein WR25_00687 [Diploscapter pachys]|uniref:Aminopeptidase n=1 Tax=Diploscapter pachys TaxID=2018661 RepID=A0A2A2J997_9BILA|nr:hypothetical protein WR25_00687 [Diploscapter pachys]
MTQNFSDGWAMVNFDTTPIMSTYLIAVAVGPFVSANYTNDVGTIARAWGWTGQEAYLQFSAEVAGKCLYQLGVYTNFTYPLPKSDNLGLPQFPAGAMENWGLVIYAYDDLVFNPNTMTTDDMERCIIVICHELTHQWFGDLITMAWWSDLFLNEGFAEYFESFIQTKVYPEQFDYIDAAVVKNDVQGALRYDVSNGAHPIIDPNGPYFDTITYSKGASMLRMTQDVLGEDVMREGLQNYVQKFQYSNALHPDLFDEFDKVSQKYNIKDWCGNTLNVTHFLEPYFHQSNFPLISYSNAAFFTQPKTSQSPWQNVSSLKPSEFNYEWDIPLRTLYYYQRNANTAEWNGKISPSALIQMLGDEMAIVSDQQAKSLPYSYDRLLTLMRTIFRTSQFVNNPNGPLFEMVMSQIDYFASFFRDSVDAHLMHLFIYEIFGPAYSNLNWTLSNSWATNTFMETFLPYAVRYGLHDAANRTLTMYQNIKAACITSTNGTHWCNPYPPDLHRAIYCGATLYSNEAIDYFGNILNHYNNEVTNNYYFFQEYYALLEGLTCSQRPQDLKVLIRFFVNSKLNSRTIFGWLKYNSVAGDALFSYMMENPDQVLAYGGFSAYMDAMTFSWKSDRRMKQYSQLQNLKFTPDTQATYNTYMDRIGQSVTIQLFRYCQKVLFQINFMSSEFPMTLRWFYDNLVIMSHTPWRVRLDGNVVIPKGYSLIVQPYVPSLTTYMFYLNMTFTGASTMNFTVSQTTDTIRLNVHRIQIFPDYVTLTDSSTASDLLNGTLVQLSKDYDNAIMTIKFPLTLQTGTVYTLGFNYVGFILNKAASGVDANWNYYEFNDKKGQVFLLSDKKCFI